MNRKFIVDMGWEALLEDLGLDPADLLRKARLPEDLFSQKHPTLTTDQYFRLWDNLEVSGEGEDWPLKLVRTITPETFSPPLFAALCSPNLKSALQRLSEFKPLIGPMSLPLKQTADGMSATFEVTGEVHNLPPALLTMELCFLVNLARIATRTRVVPHKVTAPVELGAAYIEYFGAAPHNGSTATVEFAHADLDKPFLTANASMWDFFEPQLRQRLRDLEGQSTTHQRVESVMLELLPAGESSIERVAEKLAMSKRTLQRKLKAEDTSFQSVLESIRTKLAKYYLQHEHISGIEIAFLLGFDSQSAFIRAFTNWVGMSPEKFRSIMQDNTENETPSGVKRKE